MFRSPNPSQHVKMVPKCCRVIQNRGSAKTDAFSFFIGFGWPLEPLSPSSGCRSRLRVPPGSLRESPVCPRGVTNSISMLPVHVKRSPRLQKYYGKGFEPDFGSKMLFVCSSATPVPTNWKKNEFGSLFFSISIRLHGLNTSLSVGIDLFMKNKCLAVLAHTEVRVGPWKIAQSVSRAFRQQI